MANNEADFLAKCASFGTGAWSDSLDQLGIEGVVRGLTKRSGAGQFAARAVTVKQVVARLGTFTRDDYGIARMLEAAGPRQSLMIDMEGGMASTLGGIAGLAARSSGIAAVVIDGSCRDVDELQEIGLWVASRHAAPTTGKFRVKIVSIGDPVIVGGIPVSAGDLVIGDDSGIVVTPSARIEETFALAEKTNQKDVKLATLIKSGKSYTEALELIG